MRAHSPGLAKLGSGGGAARALPPKLLAADRSFNQASRHQLSTLRPLDAMSVLAAPRLTCFGRPAASALYSKPARRLASRLIERSSFAKFLLSLRLSIGIPRLRFTLLGRKSAICKRRSGATAASDMKPHYQCYRCDGDSYRSRTTVARCVRAQRRRRYIVTIEDTGTGFAPGDIDRIFDTFFTTKSHGMGMGLAICRTIVEAHGGRLSASPGYPYGAVFRIVLPVVGNELQRTSG